MLWEPNIRESVARLPDICLANQEIWRTMSPLICFETVEWHHPERVLRQFGLHQGIPLSCSLEQELHLVDRRGCHKYDWETYHTPYVVLWATPDPDTLPRFPGWSRLVKSHCTIPREDTVELHLKEGSKHMH